MAIHKDLWTLAEEAIHEYILTAQCCLGYRKPDNGCLGYPAALLLLCVVNALGTYMRNEPVRIDGKEQLITGGEPFRVLDHALFGQTLSHKQIKIIEKAYRNLLAHNAMLAPNAWLLPGKGDPIFVFNGESVNVYIVSLFEMVNQSWQNLDKSKIRKAVEKGYIR